MRKRSGWTALCAALLLVALAAPAAAAPGDTDTAWGTAGKRFLATQLSGLPDQSPSTTSSSFVVTNSTGVSLTAWTEVNPSNVGQQSAYAFVPADGTLGTVVRSTTEFFSGRAGSDPAGRFLVATVEKASPFTGRIRRYLANGSPDTSFGTGGALVISGVPYFLANGTFIVVKNLIATSYGAEGGVTSTTDLTGVGLSSVLDVRQDDSGFILVAGVASTGGGSTAKVVQLFAGSGKVNVSYLNPTVTVVGPISRVLLGVLGTGAFYLVVRTGNYGAHVFRANSAGEVSGTFGGSGEVALPDDEPARNVLVDQQGDLILATGQPLHADRGILYRFNAAGLDVTLTGSSASVTEAADGIVGYDSIAALPDGGVLVSSGIRSTNPDTVRLRKVSGLLHTLPSKPGVPVVTAAGAQSATISWSAPAGAGSSPITSYRVRVITPPTPGGITFDTGSAARTFSTAGLGNGPVAFSVAAKNAEGYGAESSPSSLVLPPFKSATLFTNQQFADMEGRAPTAAERAAWSDSFYVNGSSAVVARVVDAGNSPNWAPVVDPVTRLFYAYFSRPADASGLGYWSGQRRAGKPLDAMSSAFAGSSEFKATYGSLTNRAFVERVYQNVLGRPGEASGVDYWTAQLNAKKKTRGKVMIGFSEANEHKVRRAGEVNTIDIFYGLLRRVPTAAELTTWTADAKAFKGAPVQSILQSAEYATRVT